MKKIILSTVVMGTIGFAGGDITEPSSYVNSDNNSADIEMLKEELSRVKDKLTKLENRKPIEVKSKVIQKEPKHHGVTIKSHAGVIKLNGTHYIGFVNSSPKEGDSTNKFETRRNYFQAKAYFKEDPKDYVRITMDTHDTKDGESNIRLKYAYLYLNNILPHTGVEFGQAHRPWIDYEEHNGWFYRSISKTLVEAKYGADITNSADRGINFKTKLDYFSSELGVFNGEGYHNKEDGRGLSKEWRLTGHILGTGKRKSKKSLTYANISFFGQQNSKSNKHGNKDLNWMGLHAVYNQPLFLVAGEYIDVSDGIASKKGIGYSVNGEYRFMSKFSLLGRYDYFDMDDNSGDKKRAIAGLSYEYNKNVEFILNYLKEGGDKLNDTQKRDAFMITAEVEW